MPEKIQNLLFGYGIIGVVMSSEFARYCAGWDRGYLWCVGTYATEPIIGERVQLEITRVTNLLF